MKTPIIQFGTSRFLQAHADLFISEALAAGAAIGPITVVKTSGSAERESRLEGLRSPNGYPVHIKGLMDGKIVDEVITVKSVVRALSTHADWTEVTRIFVDEAEVIISNTAESGYDLNGDDAGRPAGIPASYPGKLLALLYARHQAGRPGLTILPTELVSRNGDVLKSLVNQLAGIWYGDAAFVDWIDSQAPFANTLVDRIVSKALEPAGAVCEPYALWAIEHRSGMTLPCSHPSIMLTHDISPFERLKLFILNLGHSVLVQHWIDTKGSQDLTVREILADPDARSVLETLYRDEVLPGFAAKGMADEAHAYVATTLERFDNPFLDHYLLDIQQHHNEKIRRRVGGFVSWCGTSGKPRLSALLARAGD